MKPTLFFIIALFLSASFKCDNNPTYKKMPFAEEDILKQLDLAFEGIPNEYYPKGNNGDIKYNFMLDPGAWLLRNCWE